MSRRSRARALRAPGRWALVAAAAALTLSGCTYADREPGLFGTTAPSESPTPVPSPPAVLPRAVSAALPVAGDRTWTTAEGRQVSVRFAVNAIRRIAPATVLVAGATVLDWSVTVLGAPGYAAGSPLPTDIDLGLTRGESGELALDLVDPVGRRVYRPLSQQDRDQGPHCLCTSLWLAQQRLVVGETQLLQVAYPALPASVDAVDLQLPTAASFSHVPVTAAGQAPTARGRADLTRPAPVVRPATRPHAYRPAGSRSDTLAVRVDRVVALPTSTSLEWTVRSMAAQDLLPLAYGPPLAADLPLRIDVRPTAPADGARLRAAGLPAGDRSRVRWSSVPPSGGRDTAYACLCSDVWLHGDVLRRTGGVLHLTATFAALPVGTRRVDVSLPGVAPFTDVPVGTAEDAATRLGPPAAGEVGIWTYDQVDPPPGRTVAEWPTPLPAAGQLPGYDASVGDLVAWPS